MGDACPVIGCAPARCRAVAAALPHHRRVRVGVDRHGDGVVQQGVQQRDELLARAFHTPIRAW